jgi:hypothetical protein
VIILREERSEVLLLEFIILCGKQWVEPTSKKSRGVFNSGEHRGVETIIDVTKIIMFGRPFLIIK